MVSLTDLWLAIVLAAVGVFVASSLVHMVIGWHKADYKNLPGEDAIGEAMRAQSVPPGRYMIPCADSYAEAQTPEMIAKFESGPVAFLSVLPNGMPGMGKALLQWFLYTLLVGVFIAYIATLSLKAGAEYMHVFRVTGTVAVMVYAVPRIVDSIWNGIDWSITARYLADGVIYGLVSAGVFSWQWPAAAA